MKRTQKILLSFLVLVLAILAFSRTKDDCDREYFETLKDEAVITLPAGCTFQISSEIEVTDDLTIYGNGSTIESSGAHRIFLISADAAVYLNNLTLTGVNISNTESERPLEGGVIHNSGTLTLENIHIADNFAHYVYGLGLYNAQEGHVEILSSIFENNSGVSGQGGAIFNKGYLELTDSNVIHNSLVFAGERKRNAKEPPELGYSAGIRNTPTGNLIISGSIISHNRANNYAAIYSGGYLQMDLTVIEANEAMRTIESVGGTTGGLVNSGTAFIYRSQVIDNISFAGAGGISNRSVLWINKSIIHSNRVTGPYFSGCTGLRQSTLRLRPLGIIAQENYWGASSGPGGDGPGDGDGICDVEEENYTPWLTEAPHYN